MADLTTVAAVKQYLATPSANVDALIATLIPRESRQIEKYTGRVFPYVAHTGKRLDGTGTSMLMLPDQPIISVQSLSASGVAIAAAADSVSPGFLFDETMLYLNAGAKFPYARQAVQVSWQAGYQSNEAATIPDGNVPVLTITDPGSPVTINGIVGDDGTVYASSANAPGPGQYQFVRPAITFNTADAGKGITVSMNYVPAPVEQACIEMVGIDLKQRDNLGIRSKTLANETIVYEASGLTASVKEMLQGFRKVAPV